MTDEAHEWYQAYRFGELIQEGPTPVPNEVFDEATEIRWSDPSKDKNFAPDSEPVSAEAIEELQNDPPIERTPPPPIPEKPNVPRYDPSDLPKPTPDM